MIQWSEEKDRYVLRVSRWEEVAFSFVTLLASTLLAILILSFMAERRRTSPLCYLATIANLVFFLRIILTHWDHRAWVEVPLHGGPVRWGRPDLPEMTRPVQVARFEVGPVGSKCATVIAVLPDGTRVGVLGRWHTYATGRVTGLVEQLNAILAGSHSDGAERGDWAEGQDREASGPGIGG